MNITSKTSIRIFNPTTYYEQWKPVNGGTINVHVLLLFWRSHRKYTMNKNKMFVDEYRYHLDGDIMLAIDNRSVAGKSLFSRKSKQLS